MWEPTSQGTRGSSLALLHHVAQRHLCPPWGCHEHARPCGREEGRRRWVPWKLGLLTT